ncbi:hypothetical protein OPV22_004443 [Ensete ventricosum]|uniref:Uncharacterized protein n=1 Tax=Ensete ventricosum TaxID=4639 RepID=A0AAV8S3M2_ENSVE|nr:hypothetical protein OPV22_004443 [Ensete ventricosum]RWV85394.1 hypothetical protein GW17_00052818 [Ensete ventricosum]RZS02639.1 hypothetical protein BHM03_00032709 [Ensete ventricosum]
MDGGRKDDVAATHALGRRPRATGPSTPPFSERSSTTTPSVGSTFRPHSRSTVFCSTAAVHAYTLFVFSDMIAVEFTCSDRFVCNIEKHTFGESMRAGDGTARSGWFCLLVVVVVYALCFVYNFGRTESSFLHINFHLVRPLRMMTTASVKRVQLFHPFRPAVAWPLSMSSILEALHQALVAVVETSLLSGIASNRHRTTAIVYVEEKGRHGCRREGIGIEGARCHSDGEHIEEAAMGGWRGHGTRRS